MSFKWTNEQEAIIDNIVNPTHPILAISAVAGSSKTSTLVEASKRYKQLNPNGSIRFIVFGKALADESKLDFGTNAIVSTVHSMAHSAIIKPFGLNSQIASFIHWKDVPIKLPFNSLPTISKLIDDYCASSHLSLTTFLLTYPEDLPRNYPLLAQQLMDLMATGKMRPTHSLYLKMYHLLVMNGTIQLPPVDILMVDEFQDISSQVLDIIEKIPAKQKVFTGDRFQTIFQFLNLENGFARYPDAKVLTLSKSFRVTKPLAHAIQHFMQYTSDPDFIFEGMDYPENPTINTEAYLTRTNAELIGKMVELNSTNTPYRLAHKLKIKQMFKLPVTLITTKPGGTQYDTDLKYIQSAIDKWSRIPDSPDKPSKLVHLMKLFPDDTQLQAAAKLIITHGSDTIMDAYTGADKHKNSPGILLCTAHTSKGLTLDRVELSEGMEDSVSKALFKLKVNSPLDGEDIASINLYYVACSRCRYELINSNNLFIKP